MVLKLILSGEEWSHLASGVLQTVPLPPAPHPAGPCRFFGARTRTAPCRPCQNLGISEIEIHACGIHRECCLRGVVQPPHGPVQSCAVCPDYEGVPPAVPVHVSDGRFPWEGVIRRKPWEYSVTAAIPHLDTPAELELVVDLLRLQTIPPYIMLIDTGSRPAHLERLGALRREAVEVHHLAFHAVRHSSDLPAIAMDLAVSACRSEWLLCTHADVFLRRRDVVEELLDLAIGSGTSEEPQRVAVGYQMSPRRHPGWERMVSHTLTLLHVPTLDQIGAGWSLRRWCRLQGHPEWHTPGQQKFDNWPDTECLINHLLWEHGYSPESGRVLLIGQEQNQARTLDDRIDHCRSLTVARLYSGDAYLQEVEEWTQDARREGELRRELWWGAVSGGNKDGLDDGLTMRHNPGQPGQQRRTT